MSLGFNVEIEPNTASLLAANGYYLAVQKATVGATDPVQWVTYRILAPSFEVRWESEYGVYYTVSNVVQGSVIRPSANAEALLGRAYEYKNAVFTGVGSSSPGTIGVVNGLDVSGTFGATQLAYDLSGNPILSPVAVTRDVNPAYFLTLRPTETVTIYFTNRYTQNGTVVDPSGDTLTQTIQPGVTPTFYYDGKWQVRPSAAKLALSASLEPSLPLHLFRVVLAGPLPVYAVLKFFTALLPGSKVKVTDGYLLTVYGPDPWAKLEGVIGKEIDNVIKEEVSAGYYILSGRGAVIEAIIPANTPESVLWNTVFKHAPASK